MKTENKHTPTPWYNEDDIIRDRENHDQIAVCDEAGGPHSSHMDIANAAHIVLCVNSHESLKAEIALLKEKLFIAENTIEHLKDKLSNPF